MNKSLKTILIILAVLAGLWYTGKFTGMLQYFSSPTISGYPTLKPGDHFFVSNLVKLKRFELVCYKAFNEDLKKEEIRVHRLCGMEGDLVEIKDGDLYINNHYVDDSLTIAHDYIFSENDMPTIEKITDVDEKSLREVSPDSFAVCLPDKMVRDSNVPAKRIILETGYYDPLIEKTFSKEWNQDHFGPIRVPAGKLFFMGDNRHNSLDSRYAGYIDKKDYVGTVIWRE